MRDRPSKARAHARRRPGPSRRRWSQAAQTRAAGGASGLHRRRLPVLKRRSLVRGSRMRWPNLSGVDEETSTKLALVQPTRRRSWEIRRGDELVGELRVPSLKHGGTAIAGGRELRIDATGFFKTEHRLLDAATGEELARVRGRAARFEGGEQAEWKSLGRGAGSGFVGPDGEAWLRAKVRSGFLRTTGQIEVADGRDVAVPALLAAYLLIRRAEETASAAAATVAAT